MMKKFMKTKIFLFLCLKQLEESHKAYEHTYSARRDPVMSTRTYVDFLFSRVFDPFKKEDLPLRMVTRKFSIKS